MNRKSSFVEICGTKNMRESHPGTRFGSRVSSIKKQEGDL